MAYLGGRQGSVTGSELARRAAVPSGHPLSRQRVRRSVPPANGNEPRAAGAGKILRVPDPFPDGGAATAVAGPTGQIEPPVAEATSIWFRRGFRALARLPAPLGSCR